jgi:uncharacterized protein
MRKAILATIVMLAVTITPFAKGAEPAEKQRTISTNGEAVVYVMPDEVVINFGVRTTDPNLDKARAENDAKGASFVKAMKEVGIEEKYIQTDAMSVNVVYRQGNEMQVDGYRTTRSYAIRLKDVKKFEKVVDAGLKNGANVFDGFDYQSTELRKYRDQARSMAVKAAKEKATALAKELDCAVGAPVTISESSGNYYYASGRSRGYNGYANAQNSVQFVEGNAPNGDVMPLGQISISASVSVIFDLIPPK